VQLSIITFTSSWSIDKLVLIMSSTHSLDDGKTQVTISRYHEIKINENVEFSHVSTANNFSREVYYWLY